MNIIDKIKNRHLREIIHYSAGCAFSLLLKMAVSACLAVAGMNENYAYIIALCIVLVFSFFYHRHITFGQKHYSLKSLARDFLYFAWTMLFFNTADYLIVVFVRPYLEKATVEYLGTQNTLITTSVFMGAIIISTLVMFILRFICYKYIFRHKKES